MAIERPGTGRADLGGRHLGCGVLGKLSRVTSEDGPNGNRQASAW
jgi:hypothetical protein